MNSRKVGLALFICLSVFFPPQNVFSDDIAKADKYYERLDYHYAIKIYEKIMQRKPSVEVAQKLANCYRYINDSELSEQAFAKVLTYSGFDPINYKYYADALKQNGKFQEAKENYLLYGERVPEQSVAAKQMADACDVAGVWAANPNPGIQVESESQINSNYAEFAPVKFNDGFVFVSDRFESSLIKRKIYGWTGNSYLKLYKTDSNRSVSTLSLLPKPINNEFHNGPAIFTQDNKEIYFTRTNLIKVKKSKSPQIGKKFIYHSVRSGDSWSEPIALSISVDANVQHPALSVDGNILYFASNMSDGFGGMDIYAVKKQEDGSWGTPVNCGESINTAEDEVFPTVRYDGKFYFSSKGHLGMGGLDVFSAQGSYNTFSDVQNLKAPMNSTKDDFGILFLKDDAGLISSNRNGGQGLDDIYRFQTIVATTASSSPTTTNTDSINNSTPVDNSNNSSPNSTTNNINNNGTNVNAPNKVIPLLAIEGIITDQSGVPIKDVKIHLINNTTDRKKTVLSDALGKFYYQLESEMEYTVQGDANKSFADPEVEISTKNITESTVYNVKFQLKNPEEEGLFTLNNIYYNFNKWNLRPDALFELNKLVNVIQKQPEVVVEIRSHTDVRGTSSYNLWLSQKRAQSVITYLKKKGVSAKQLKALGFGETEVVNRCKEGVDCTEADHQLNRRTEFKIIKAE